MRRPHRHLGLAHVSSSSLSRSGPRVILVVVILVWATRRPCRRLGLAHALLLSRSGPRVVLVVGG